MASNIVKLNEFGFPGISESTNDPEGGTAAPISRFKAVYEYGASFGLDFKFNDITVDELGAQTISDVILELVSFDSSIGIKCQQIGDDVLRFSGKASEVFTDSYYDFVLYDKSVKRLPVNTTTPYMALTSWSPPSTKFKELSHSLKYKIKLKVPLVGQPNEFIEETMTINQGVYWSYPIAVQQFRTALSKGII